MAKPGLTDLCTCGFISRFYEQPKIRLTPYNGYTARAVDICNVSRTTASVLCRQRIDSSRLCSVYPQELSRASRNPHPGSPPDAATCNLYNLKGNHKREAKFLQLRGVELENAASCDASKAGRGPWRECVTIDSPDQLVSRRAKFQACANCC
ncbi:uncharacterized protein BO97DRAFT_465240 [Aspergillus homomorphus CBS 101889]|uniref:Uncharacterized protein n=1 Tax=Aspergillus homomorphus (strain CBS 101889) TaxID=1450537 RepID=A0A395I526_ASPHC|nr:hypothetical protein BO97DRAFT_465240 [Aspergillus homomorphus CBS 101889]RAL14673.1 hypothetical protein BO97DRAFT_465240 [Aspergillus homomorphus CBS 101889]